MFTRTRYIFPTWLALFAVSAILLAWPVDAREWNYGDGDDRFYGELLELNGESRIVVFEEWRGTRSRRRSMSLDMLAVEDVQYIADVANGIVEYEEYGRIWTDQKGNRLRAEFQARLDDGRVVFLCEDGTEVKVPMEQLTLEDQQLIISQSRLTGTGIDGGDVLAPEAARQLAADSEDRTDSAVVAPTPLAEAADMPWYELPVGDRAEARAALIAEHAGLFRSLYVLAGMLWVAGWLWLSRIAFTISREWFWLVLIGGPLSAGLTCLIFAVARFQQVRIPFLVWLGGVTTLLITYVFLPYSLA